MILGFGEVMARMAPPLTRRWAQTLPGMLEVTWGGGEANVCASLALYGQPVRYLTALPDNSLAECLTRSLRGLGIDVSAILRREGRLGLYFVEVGANQRSSTVLYDRQGSSVSQAEPAEYDWERSLAGVQWVHVTGITPAISAAACRANLELVKQAKARGCTVSCDLNFRKKLWRWEPDTDPKSLARRSMGDLLPYVDLVIGNEEDAADVLDIHAAGSDVEQGQINVAGYQQVAEQVVGRFPNVRLVAITLRESYSANHNNWGALLYDAAQQKVHLAPLDAAGNYRSYEIRDIVDRVGAGDSFAAGLIHALNTDDLQEPSTAIRFAVAASCLKHSVHGDFNYVSEAEVRALMAGDASGRVRR